MQRNRQIVVTQLPNGNLTENHFKMQEGDIPGIRPGQVLIRTRLISTDAVNRIWLRPLTYRISVNVGDVMPAMALGEVVETQDDALDVGDLVVAESLWADYAAINVKQAIKIAPSDVASHHLWVYGLAGRTAHQGMLRVGNVQAGETVVVSAAGGSVGLLAGQIAREQGCYVVGIAGGADKCAWVTETLGFDACVDRHDAHFLQALKDACPDGIDMYFDNVGGQVLEDVVRLMNVNGRIVCCGAVSQFDELVEYGPANIPALIIVKRLRMEGFIARDCTAHEIEQAVGDMKQWVGEGKINVIEDIVEGLANAPSALIGLLAGENKGKRMVRVS